MLSGIGIGSECAVREKLNVQRLSFATGTEVLHLKVIGEATHRTISTVNINNTIDIVADHCQIPIVSPQLPSHTSHAISSCKGLQR